MACVRPCLGFAGGLTTWTCLEFRRELNESLYVSRKLSVRDARRCAPQARLTASSVPGAALAMSAGMLLNTSRQFICTASAAAQRHSRLVRALDTPAGRVRVRVGAVGARVGARVRVQVRVGARVVAKG